MQINLQVICRKFCVLALARLTNNHEIVIGSAQSKNIQHVQEAKWKGAKFGTHKLDTMTPNKDFIYFFSDMVPKFQSKKFNKCVKMRC